MTASTILIEDRIYRAYATRGALSVPGVVTHASGINRITGRTLPRAELRWDADHRSVTVDLQVAVSWPSPVVDVAAAVRDSVARWVTDATGAQVAAVNVEVAAVVPVTGARSRVTVDDLEDAPQHPDLAPVSARPLAPESPVVHRVVTAPVHPTTTGHRALTPVRATRPPLPWHVPTPDPVTLSAVHTAPRPPVRHVPDPVRPALTAVVAPAPRPAVVPRVPDPVPLDEITVDHSLVRDTPFAEPPQVLREIPTPPGPRLENIPTPQGLPTTTVPTPQGLPVTVFPQIPFRAPVIVTVNRHPRIRVSVPRRDERRPSTARE